MSVSDIVTLDMFYDSIGHYRLLLHLFRCNLFLDKKSISSLNAFCEYVCRMGWFFYWYQMERVALSNDPLSPPTKSSIQRFHVPPTSRP